MCNTGITPLNRQLNLVNGKNATEPERHAGYNSNVIVHITETCADKPVEYTDADNHQIEKWKTGIAKTKAKFELKLK